MSKSGDKINYMLRPAKSIERKLIKDSLTGVVQNFGQEKYKYIGFGSKYFADFLYFHRHLHINEMISIEVDSSNSKVYEFNKPFSCVELKFGHSNDILPELDLSCPVIVWLDYDGVFDRTITEDIVNLFSRCSSGSVIIVSYNSRPFKIGELQAEFDSSSTKGLIQRALSQRVGEEAIPYQFNEKGLGKWEAFSKLIKKIADNHIHKAIGDRNVGEQDPFKYQQMFYFDYKDGVEMSTIGGIVYKNSDEDKWLSSCSHKYSFVRAHDERCLIEIPALTSKEARELLAHTPIDSDKIRNLKRGGVFKEKDIMKFNEFYKYYPSYSEIEL
ncbi:O-methyltransferase [Billgrantia antri]|uniref:Uncharacterized protein n=1 Tax=Billgrantia antri TaxID=2846777 RepID=A0ABS6ZKM6_9GAMM|nr:O-methyltransferase [Halomonas antri]MBW6390606.1 hypothetical protein [Halomonas antri]